MIGVVGPEDEAAELVEAFEAAGASVLAAEAAEAVREASTTVVTLGEPALQEVIRHDLDAPVLPLDAGPELPDERPTPDTVVRRVLDGDYERRTHPLLAVEVDGSRTGRALFDVMLDTAEPGRISEYGVETAGVSREFRADGVVAATPLGTRGYAAVAGGPRLGAGIDAVAVVPIAVFEFDARSRVVEPPIALSVRRDECRVCLLTDGRERRTVEPGSEIDVTFDGELAVLGPRTGLEKH